MSRPSRRGVALVVGVWVVLAGCAGAEREPVADPRTSESRQTPARSASASASASASPSPTPTLPQGGRILFPRWRIVAFYGAAGSAGMGVLGGGSPDEVWPRLAKTADHYARPDEPVLPAYELIAVIASSRPEGDGKYRRRVGHKVVGRYLEAARRHDALLILDIQPGQADFLTEARRLGRWLNEPDVALALDPEWHMGPDERPGEVVGSVKAAEINAVSTWLSDLTRQHRLPEKLLLIHQFTDDMVRHPGDVRDRGNLEIVFNMDGFGAPGAKISRYRALTRKTDFPLGFKLFYEEDTHLLDPDRVLDLDPAPRVIEYQ